MGNSGQKKSRWKRLRLGGESGQALVELALTTPLLVLLLLGAAELARIAYAAIEVSNAAEAGAQYATQNPSLMNYTAGINAAAQADATLTGITATPIAWTHTCSDGSTPDAINNCATGTALTAVKIRASVTFDPLIHLPFLGKTITIYGYATEKCRSY